MAIEQFVAQEFN